MQKMILMVDDDPDDVLFFCNALYESNKPYYCISVTNAEEALQFLEHTLINPEFIFLDLNMPRVNGKECLKKLKTNPQSQDIPVIVYSTSSQKREIDEMYKLGASKFVSKPYSMRVLIDTLSDILTCEKQNHFEYPKKY
jgi:CheY-like chemotaxis protein